MAFANNLLDRRFPFMKSHQLPVSIDQKINMKTTPEQDERIANLKFASVYPLYVAKVEKKGRSVDELHEVIKWLTGFSESKLKVLIESEVKRSMQELDAFSLPVGNLTQLQPLLCHLKRTDRHVDADDLLELLVFE